MLSMIRQVAYQQADKDLVENQKKFEAQAPASGDLIANNIKVICEGFCTALIPKIEYIIKNEAGKYSLVNFTSSDKTIPEAILKLGNPFMAEIGDAVSHAVEQAAGQAPSRGAMRLQDIKDTKGADQKLIDAENTKESISALQTQTALLTSAVAKTYSKEDEFKLRLRNLEGVVTTRAVLTGDAGPRRTNKETREAELKTWLEGIARKHNKHIGPFQLFIIDPRLESRQKTSAILTVSLADDKFKLEQCISAERKVTGPNPHLRGTLDLITKLSTSLLSKR